MDKELILSKGTPLVKCKNVGFLTLLFSLSDLCLGGVECVTSEPSIPHPFQLFSGFPHKCNYTCKPSPMCFKCGLFFRHQWYVCETLSNIYREEQASCLNFGIMDRCGEIVIIHLKREAEIQGKARQKSIMKVMNAK